VTRLAEVLAVNAIALYGLTRGEWSLATLFVVYWGENLLNTFFVGGRILLHRVLTRKRGHWTVPNTGNLKVTINGKEIRQTSAKTTTLLASFVTTNLLFALAHGVFVVVLVFGIFQFGPQGASVRAGLLSMLIVQAVAFALDAGTMRTRSFAWIHQRADAALGRMLVLHLALIGGAFVLVWTERPASFFIVFMALKLLYDLGTAWPWQHELSEKPPGFVSALGRMVNKPGVEDVWKKEVEAQRRKQIEDEEPIRAAGASPPKRRP